ncbi:MAG: carbohydrate ABC transporter permease [Chloroflexi bacterium]|nr:carbohydrate ABC transporter permease [Chloroflexota bacterium]
MQHTKNPYVRALIHAVLILWVVYSMLPFVMSIIISLQMTRDATARQPRFMPTFLVENQIAVAVVLALIIAGIFAVRWIQQGTRLTRGHFLRVGAALVVVIGGFLLATATVPANQTFNVTWASYQELWLTTEIEEFIPYGIGLLALVVVLIAAGIGAGRFPYAKTYVYLGIVAVIVGTVVLLPSLVPFAEFYDFFLNSVIVTTGTVFVSISIGCLAGYGLARSSSLAGVIVLFGALAFRALPRLAFILPYYYFAQLSGLYDTYLLLIITFVAINQPFTIWMLRSFFMEIPRELEEAAMIDGCNRLTAFWRVIIPITWPGIITTALFTLLLAYNEFLLANLLTSTLSTLPVGISRFTSGEDVRLLPLSNASAVSITLPIIFIIIFFQRHLIKGLAGGAIKG